MTSRFVRQTLGPGCDTGLLYRHRALYLVACPKRALPDADLRPSAAHAFYQVHFGPWRASTWIRCEAMMTLERRALLAAFVVGAGCIFTGHFGSRPSRSRRRLCNRCLASACLVRMLSLCSSAAILAMSTRLGSRTNLFVPFCRSAALFVQLAPCQ